MSGLSDEAERRHRWSAAATVLQLRGTVGETIDHYLVRLQTALGLFDLQGDANVATVIWCGSVDR
jgi:hypothetical protein